MKHIVQTLLTLMVAISALSQQVKHINFLDLPSARFKETFKTNNKAKVQIDNINRFIYKVTAEKAATDFNVTVPTALAGIKLPAFFSSQMPKNNAAPSPVPLSSSSKTAKDFSDEIDLNLQELIKVQQTMNQIIDMHNKVVDISKNCSKGFADIESDVIKEVQGILGNSNTSISTLSAQLENDLSNLIATAKISHEHLEELLKNWETARKSEYRLKSTGDADVLVDQREALEDLKGQLKAEKNATKKNELKVKIKRQEKRIRDLEATAKAGEEDYTIERADQKEKIAKAKELWTEIDKFRAEGKVYMLVNDIRKVNIANYTYFSETVKMDKDEYKFTFSIAANEPLPCNKANEEKFDVTLRSKGGVKIDFSTGIFFNFGKEDFLGREYYYQKISSTESQIMSVDAGKRVLFSLGALMHIYKRSPEKAKLGAGIGASTSTSFDAFNFHIGPTLILGDKDRICITAGLTLREAKLLDSRYQMFKDYTTEALPESVPTIKKFPVAGSFLALSYNFSKINKQ